MCLSIRRQNFIKIMQNAQEKEKDVKLRQEIISCIDAEAEADLKMQREENNRPE